MKEVVNIFSGNTTREHVEIDGSPPFKAALQKVRTAVAELLIQVYLSLTSPCIED